MLDAESWKVAVLDLLGGTCGFARVGPRRHRDWRRDVASTMALRSDDPRRWYSLSAPPAVEGDRSGIGAPFMLWSAEQIGAALTGIDGARATRLLIALQGEPHYQAAHIPDFANRRDALFRSARHVLSRFGPSARFLTNASGACADPDADWLNPDTQWECLSVHTTDCGLVAVSDDEVGVFWAFWED
ncbi:hypothetical protein ACF061_10055 [Streptomyces sp. NPDC015220]|uniref:hypothetical protein n=1 Tax=Streptomyces sp. NPDC015220 TaxID=3364947 RepID=UPI0036FD0967